MAFCRRPRRHLLNLHQNMPFFDVQAGCTGFNYSLALAEQFVNRGNTKQSRWSDRTSFQPSPIIRIETPASFLGMERSRDLAAEG